MAESDDKQNKNIVFLSFLRNVVQIIERHKYLAIFRIDLYQTASTVLKSDCAQ